METKNRQGIYTVIAAIAIQLSLGIAYLWSIFQTGIANSIFGGDNAAAGLTFSLLLATLTIGSVIGGKLAAKYSTRVVVIAGGIILSVGFFLASFVTAQSAWALWLTYGVMGGVGMGFTYSTTIALAQKWFPAKKGLVTGIIVSALGFGGVVFTPVIESLIKTFGGVGVGEPKTFMVLAGIFLVVCTIGGLFMKNSPAAEGGLQLTGMSTKEMLKSPKFYLITVTFCLACMGGLMMIGFAKPIAVAKGLESTATIGVLAISLFNSFGRLIWGIVSDKIGRKNTIILLLICTAILSLLVNSVSGYFVYVLIGLIGFFYGGLLSTFPSLTADLFGAKNMATNYGFVLLGFGAGAILSSQVAGYYKNLAADDISLMFPAFVIASVCAVVGILLMLLLKRKTS
ncbi:MULTISPECIES: OFA family MFS transporter [unclassified Clostridium]|jgi:OFA family oxalate/formate antiporter-like MFS transporter|uniref:OFA family MFS transporter n=1 Tax=Clostridia TaxID=186801 RepID=UPI0008213927|nr:MULTISPECIES: OFA family MFS transporter [unclassified Clostridium]SCJ51787.1 Inner membrane protein yhjX [uncultured Clostridium sp.]